LLELITLDSHDLLIYLSLAGILLKYATLIGLFLSLNLQMKNRSNLYSKLAIHEEISQFKAQKEYNETNLCVNWLALCARRIEASDDCPTNRLLDLKSIIQNQGGKKCLLNRIRLYPQPLNGVLY